MFASAVFSILALCLATFAIAYAAFVSRIVFFIGAVLRSPTDIVTHHSEESASHPSLRIAESATSLVAFDPFGLKILKISLNGLLREDFSPVRGCGAKQSMLQQICIPDEVLIRGVCRKYVK